METNDTSQNQARTPTVRMPVIMCVDNDEATLASLQSLFRRAGYSLHPFINTGTALEFMKRVAPDLVMCSLRMPVMTGLEFLNRASDINPEAVRVIMSGHEDKSVAVNALSKGLVQHYVLKPWNDSSLRELVRHSLDRLLVMRRQRLEEILGSLDALPAPPSFHIRLQAELARDGASVYDIAREIEKSPPIVAKLLRVANSIYFATRKSVATVRDAVFLIGTDQVAALVAAIEAFHGFTSKSRPDFNEYIETLWTESFNRAMLAKRIAERWAGFDEADTVFIASLLQDIGYAVFLCFDADTYREYRAASEEGPASAYEAEKNMFGRSHEKVGAALLEYWNLPPVIVNAVSRHHLSTGGDPFLQVMQIADVLNCGERGCLHDQVIDAQVQPWREKVLGEKETTTEETAG